MKRVMTLIMAAASALALGACTERDQRRSIEPVTHFEEDLTLADALSLLLHPRHNLSGLLRHFERRHHNAGRHNVFEFLSAECAGCFEYSFFRGDSCVLERRREGNRNMHGSHSLHRRFKAEEGAFRNR